MRRPRHAGGRREAVPLLSGPERISRHSRCRPCRCLRKGRQSLPRPGTRFPQPQHTAAAKSSSVANKKDDPPFFVLPSVSLVLHPFFLLLHPSSPLTSFPSERKMKSEGEAIFIPQRSS